MKNYFTQLTLGLMALFIYSSVQAQTVTTIAGSTSGYADGNGTAAQFKNPSWLCSDSNGNLYISDNANHRIRKITPQGQVSTLAGSTSGYADGIGTAAQFNSTSGICIDGSGNLYVSDYDNHRIRKITPQGQVSTFAGSTQGYVDGLGTAAQFNNPTGIAIDPSENLYVADSNNHRIRKITPQGQVSTLAGSTSGYADGSGTTAQFNTPFGIAIDASGNFYIADLINNRIRKITPQGQVSTLAGSTSGYADGSGTTAQFYYPYGIAIDPSGNLYVSDHINNRIRKVTQQGQVTTVAGSTEGNADGSGTAAQFKLPSGIIINTGNLYVADNGNHRIRKISFPALGTTEINTTKKVNIYPNPVGDFVTIDTSTLKNANARLYDASGKFIKETTLKNGKNSLNVNDLTKGTYIIEILSTEGKTSQKFIKQ
ncbi:T9SS type A sorting domain-containing protein [Chryseobacterium sp. PMSZPI]|uniref:T9SS type A sorting domain-containing protein n=1 Tax=Chryseobacterium sp. PMSZPI TaxID=1033900 RepID=UPI0039A233E5